MSTYNEIWVDFPNISDERLIQFMNYWHEKRNGELVPNYHDIDPLDIVPVLPYIWIFEWMPEEQDFQCRLAGEEIKEIQKTNIVGKWLKDLQSEEVASFMREQYLETINRPAMGYTVGPVYLRTIGRSGKGERVFLPFKNKDGQTTIVAGVTMYESALSTEDVSDNDTRRAVTPLDQIKFPEVREKAIA